MPREHLGEVDRADRQPGPRADPLEVEEASGETRKRTAGDGACPGVATGSASPVASRSFHSAQRADSSGWATLNIPPKPQHQPSVSRSTIRVPGTFARSVRAGPAFRRSRSRWHAAWNPAGPGSRAPGTVVTPSTSTTNSANSRTRPVVGSSTPSVP